MNTPPHSINHGSNARSSNLELYRIIVMFLIVAHHYVVNSGLYPVLAETSPSAVSSAMLLFGAWGKTGINCFVMITGYFMCRSSISLRKFLKLYFQIAFYGVVIYLTFCLAGMSDFSFSKFAWRLMPVKGVSTDFVSCFIIFYLMLPFLRILVEHLSRHMHLSLICLLLVYQTILPILPGFNFLFNYVGWFSTIFVVASYIRFYGLLPRFGAWQWGLISLVLILAGSCSVIIIERGYKAGIINHFVPYYFISDSNMILAFSIAVATFMWFKSLPVANRVWINAISATMFGVLLIHANSNTMRQWLWGDTIDCVGHFNPSDPACILYAFAAVSAVFMICVAIEMLRQRLIEATTLDPIHSRLKKILS